MSLKILVLKNKKKIKKILLSLPGFYSAACFLTKNDNPRVFVYHRFCIASDKFPHRIDDENFEWQLGQIIKSYKIVTLGYYLQLRIKKRKVPKNLAIITIDDGYYDFYEIAYPILKKMKLCATLFPTVNFVNRKIWLWPDRISYILKQSDNKKFNFVFEGKNFNCDLRNTDSAFNAWKDFSDYSIKIDDDKKWRLIAQLEKYLGITLPDIPPVKYSAVTWEQLAEMNKNGIEIGSHTMNHPILSKIKKEKLYDEINLSKSVLKDKLGCEIVSFCYPNSAPGDISEQVIEQVKTARYKGAVFGGLPASFNNIYTIPRIGVDEDKVNFIWKLSGMESLISKIYN